MTDKQIIIDGVDVSGCASYMDYGECINENVYPDYCKACSNCTYKLEQQLKAKEQECERLKKKLKPKLKNTHCVYFDGQTGWCNAKEFIRCNPIGCKLYTIDELSTIVDLQQQLDQLKVEKEELKRQHQSDKGLITSTGKMNYQLIQEYDKLKNCLAEIKEIAKNGCYDDFGMPLDELSIILQRNVRREQIRKVEILQRG